MTFNTRLIPIGALALVLGAGGFSAQAAERDGRREGGQNQGQARQRSGSGDANGARRESRGAQAPRSRQAQDDRRDTRGNNQTAQSNGRDSRNGNPPARGNAEASRGDRNNGRSIARAPSRDDRSPSFDRRDGNVRASRGIIRAPAYGHRYGSGGNFSVYFGWGGGYRYGAPFSGRVYGYSVPSAIYGSPRYYGDVRLLIKPRNAAVYVDGYYAGVVDDFDGIFQRLTLEVGPHEIEVEAPGFAPQVFNVYADPTRTVDLRGDLYPDRSY